MTARAALLVLAAVAGATTVGQAQNQYQQQITNRMARWTPTFNQRGYNAIGQLMTGSINDDADASMVVNLISGTQYVVAGVCDEDCNDVDLQLYSSDGSKIGEDLDTDATPVIAFTAQYSGQYRVRVMMATCNTSPCYYGVQIFASGGK